MTGKTANPVRLTGCSPADYYLQSINVMEQLQTKQGQILIGTAGWTIPKLVQGEFPNDGSHLERYALVLTGVEINSSFYRDHAPKTYLRWASSVPEDFRFSVKLSRYFTQEKRLKETGSRLAELLKGISQLGSKWGVLLVQLPPSLEFVPRDADRFLSGLRKSYLGAVAWEPRHLSWSTERVVDLMAANGVSKVIADPERCPLSDSLQARVETILYYRLHGSPEIYRSKYPSEDTLSIAKQLQRSFQSGKTSWCIYDNTTFGYATEDALETLKHVRKVPMKKAG